jgi:hypothetical protein
MREELSCKMYRSENLILVSHVIYLMKYSERGLLMYWIKQALLSEY